MVFGKLDQHYLGKPNELTKAMGELIRIARIEAEISQDDLAKSILARQATISDWENGKVEVGSSDLIYLSQALGKPILYFFPDWTLNRLIIRTLPVDIQNLLLSAQKLPKEDLRRLIVQVKALEDFSKSRKQKD